jgi:F0F1-type ATP synthase assembly protein I
MNDERDDAITEEFRQKSAELDAAFEARVRDLEERAAEKKAEKEAKEVRQQAVRKSDGSSMRGLALGLQLAYVLVGVPIACFGLGWWIDQQRGGKGFQSVLTILGCAVAMFYTIRILNRMQKDD